MPNEGTTSEHTSKELELLRKLRANPILADNIDLVMERFEQELANGADAHQAEEVELFVPLRMLPISPHVTVRAPCKGELSISMPNGVPWVADQFEVQFGTCHNPLIDFHHVCEYLSDAKDTLKGSEQLRTKWYETQKENLLHDKTEQALAELQVQCSPSGGRRASDRVKLPDQTPRASELPIGSGEVESGHRHILQQRLKIPGAWCLLETADEMSYLRAFRANGRWSELW